MFDIISRPFGALLKLIFDFTGSYGYAIILFTILTKILLLPINIKQTQSTKKMNEINPKMKEIQTKYKGDPEKMNEKLKELYKEHNYNPASGCLPALIQLPIIIALFRVLQNPVGFVFTPEEFAAMAKGFWWLADLGKPDQIYILPVLSALTTYLQTAMISSKGNADPTMKSMNTIMPLMIGWFTLKFPSGVALYWVVGNIFTILQQYFMTKNVFGRKGGE
ncbi:MAG: YidC/Oxa1 family membrane protein insertase [Lutispora sp.]|nr:YidC/Oxa1 family membrane protein insertase [Lutispora sp.]MDD4834284.1 YidC/Oxa1 family membrane protein insertase [Lutispora sp.]